MTLICPHDVASSITRDKYGGQSVYPDVPPSAGYDPTEPGNPNIKMKGKEKMNSSEKTSTVLEDVKINVKIKLSALWAAVMFCYIYGDWLSLFSPGFIEEMMAGKFGPFPTTQVSMLGAAIFIAIPAVMVFLSLTLKPRVNRWLNIVVSVVYTIALLITFFMGAWAYYLFLGIVEIVLKVLIIWYAWNWPRQ
jgi:hypothetical protein